MKNKRLFMRMNVWIILFGLLFFGTSCLKDEDENEYDRQVQTDDDAIKNYLSDSVQAQKHSSGFYYKILTKNDTGKSLTRGNVVEFTYKISILNGKVLEESVSPRRFKLLWGAIVPIGLDRGISLMKTGEKFRFYIPSYLAFGNYSNSLIPANSNIMVDVAVTRVRTETEIEVAQLDTIENYMKANFSDYEKFASGLYYVDSVTGTGTKAHEGDRVVIDFTRKYFNGNLIKSAIGTTIHLNHREAVQGLEEGIIQMREGGKAFIIMPASIAFSQAVCVIPNQMQTDLAREGLIWTEVQPYSIVQYNIELKTVN